jgi:S-adenosylmethionine synthetase
MVTTGTVIVSGEITTKANVNYTQLVRDTICEI